MIPSKSWTLRQFFIVDAHNLVGYDFLCHVTYKMFFMFLPPTCFLFAEKATDMYKNVLGAKVSEPMVSIALTFLFNNY